MRWGVLILSLSEPYIRSVDRYCARVRLRQGWILHLKKWTKKAISNSARIVGMIIWLSSMKKHGYNSKNYCRCVWMLTHFETYLTVYLCLLMLSFLARRGSGPTLIEFGIH